MRLATIHHNAREETAVILSERVVPMSRLAVLVRKNWPSDLLGLLESGGFHELHDWYRRGGEAELTDLDEGTLDLAAVRFAPLIRRPHKLWGIGLNYAAHAADLAEKSPNDEPASFMKTDNVIIGPGDEILIPKQSDKTTGEAELGIVFGKRAKDVDEANWLDCVAGFTTILDMTAEDILRKNPRFLTRAKCFDTFLSIGPVLVTPDEIADVMKLKVATVINGTMHAENVVSNMTFPPPYLVAFHSRVFPWLPGDVLSTGTPQAVALKDGDVLECRIDGFAPLRNPVRDLKR